MLAKFSFNKKTQQAQLICDELNLIREHFSYPNEGAAFARRRGAWYIPQRKYIITPAGKYNVGITFDIIKFIKSEFPTCDIQLSDCIKETIYPKIKGTEIELDIKLRDYQKEIVTNCIKFGRGVVELATAGGKTLTMANLLESIYKSHTNPDIWKVLIIVPDLGLVNQTFNDFTKYKVSFSFSKWTGNINLDLSSNVIIANLGILQSSKTDTTWIDYVDCLVIDECHKIRAGNKLNKLFKKIETPVRFGFTGTLPEQVADLWNIYGKIGPVIYKKGSHELRQEKYISNAQIHILNVFYKTQPPYIKELISPTERYRQEFEFIFDNNFRNKIINQFSSNVKHNILILIDFIRHGETLFNLMSSINNKQVFFIRGEVDVEEREKVKQLMESHDNVICIAISKIFSTGISINNIHNIMFASAGKAKIKILQSIGRGLRLHKNKKKLNIFDIADQLKYGKNHVEKRIELYKNEKIPLKLYNLHE